MHIHTHTDIDIYFGYRLGLLALRFLKKNLIKSWIQNSVYFYCRVVWKVYKKWSQISMIIQIHNWRAGYSVFNRPPHFSCSTICLYVCQCRTAAADCGATAAVWPNCPTGRPPKIIYTLPSSLVINEAFVEYLMQFKKFTYTLYIDLNVVVVIVISAIWSHCFKLYLMLSKSLKLIL